MLYSSKQCSFRKICYNILIFFTTIEKEESIAKSSRMIDIACEKIRIASKKIGKAPSKHKAFFTHESNFEQASFEKVKVFVHYTVRFVLIITVK